MLRMDKYNIFFIFIISYLIWKFLFFNVIKYYRRVAERVWRAERGGWWLSNGGKNEKKISAIDSYFRKSNGWKISSHGTKGGLACAP